MQTAVLPGRPQQGGHHLVRFYEREPSMLDAIADFADASLRCGGTAIIIATPAHQQALRARLRGFGEARRDQPWFPGELVMFDAEALLPQVLVDNWPDEGRLMALLGPALDAAVALGRPVHVFGEMVALLCQQGNHAAAVYLEGLWNRVSERLPIRLLCGYPSSLFASANHAAAFEQICHAHDGTCFDDLTTPHDPRQAAADIAALQHRVRVLEQQVARLQQSESTLQGRVRELTDFVNNAAEGLHRVAADGTILWANRAELEMMGYRYDEYVGRHIAEFHVDEPVIQSILQRLAAGETLYDQPARLRARDGTIRHVLIHSNGYFEDGKLLYTRCFTRDATDRLSRQAAERQRDAVLMNAPVAAALLVGPDHHFELANKRYCEMVGVSDEQLVGRPFVDVFPELRDGGVPRLLDFVYSTGTPFSSEQYHAALRQSDGTLAARYFKLNLDPLRGLDGEVEGVIAVATDITEQVQDRMRLERFHVERERLLAELREASRAKDEFLAMLGHELRNPLSPIVTALQLMRLRHDSATEREQQIIQRQVDHLVRLVDDLLDVSRITRGEIELKTACVPLREVLDKAVEMAAPLLEQRHHRFEVSVEPNLMLIVDPIRLAQAVANLLTNAARYTADGGQISLHAGRERDGRVAIRVRDNGIGIDAAMLSRIFELFVQGPRTIDRAQGGLGIGLALVRKLAELHGGTVEASSAGPGHGSEFTIRLPAPDLSAMPVAGPQPGSTRPSATDPSRRVLLVDDNADAADALAELLSAYGHRVETVYDPVAALQIAAQFEPDVALLDIGLPVMDGYELAGRLRQQLGGRPCQLIALTGYGQDNDRERSQRAGFDAHLVKPVDPERLLEWIRQGPQAQGAAGLPVPPAGD